MTNLTKCEMETVVNYNAGEQTATVYTRDKSVMRRLDRLVADYPDSYRLLRQTLTRPILCRNHLLLTVSREQ